jgi:hypothetical protein
MELILPFKIKESKQKVNIWHKLLMSGSCFAEEIGSRMQERRFNVQLNPHGILFNPSSLATAMLHYMDKKVYKEEDLIFHDDLWSSFRHHGRFSDGDQKKCLRQINDQIGQAHNQLKTGDWLVVTFGSAFAYIHRKTNQVVGNCHKIPSTEFRKILLSKNTIVAQWNEAVHSLKEFNPKLNIIFTVSPVRYIRDGLIENNRSKSILLDSVHSVVEQHEHCFYFPAYEVVIDELRDYRFYKEDLVHPNQLAADYVWEKFVAAFCDAATKNFLQEYEPLLKGLKHRSLHEDTAAAKKFKRELDKKIKELEAKYNS